jgi:hypothetical protein
MTNFRHWVHELWLQNCDENMEYHERPVTKQRYWDQYKYWLKREYRYQTKKSQEDNAQ